LNPASASPAPRLGLGCASLGTPEPQLSDADAEGVIAAAIERGIRFFDVAPLYGGGVAEERLGRALTALSRDSFTLCTKTGVTRAYATTAMPPGATRRRQFDRWDYSARATRESVERSLARLGVERLDVVHLHDVEDHLDACLEAHAELQRLRAEGLVGAIGIGSNLAAPVQALLDRAPFDTFLLAGCYTLLDQSGAAVLDAAHARGMRVVVGGVFNSGVLAAWPHSAPTYAYAPADASIRERAGHIAAVCARHGVPLAAAALQFAASHPAVATVLIGPRTIAELDANLADYAAPIPAALWSALEAAQIIAPGRAPHTRARAE
jgi:D-threo-aldose 1-dehydrogenase